MRRLLLVLGVCYAATLAHAAPAPKEADKLVLVSNRTGSADIFLISPDGKEAKNLTESKSTNSYPAWSPDGKKIAFASDRDGGMNIYVMDADGKNAKQLTKLGGLNSYAAWSPDGKQIVFHHSEGASGAFYVMDADGGNQKVLLKDEAHVEGGRPSWKPK